MSLDDLARALAEPMSRPRALRLIGTTLIAAAFPAFRPAAGRSARQATPCGPGEGCQNPDVPACCGKIDPRSATSGYWCCKTQAHCVRGPNRVGGACCETPVCGPERRCCDRNEECVDGECTGCTETRTCGRKCCREGEVCRNTRTELCCQQRFKVCSAGSAGVVKCCLPEDHCCIDFETQTAVCCRKDRNETCDLKTKRCKCPPERPTRCRDKTCCKTGKCCGATCCDVENYECVTRGKTKVCLEKCKPPRRRIGDVCCRPTRITRVTKKTVCCPAGTIAVPGIAGACCPSTKLDCCDLLTEELTPLGQLCVNGVYQAA